MNTVCQYCSLYKKSFHVVTIERKIMVHLQQMSIWIEALMAETWLQFPLLVLILLVYSPDWNVAILVKCPFMYHSIQDHSTVQIAFLSPETLRIRPMIPDIFYFLLPPKFTGHPLPRTLVSVLICISLNCILFSPSTLPPSPRAPPTAVTTFSDGLNLAPASQCNLTFCL